MPDNCLFFAYPFLLQNNTDTFWTVESTTIFLGSGFYFEKPLSMDMGDVIPMLNKSIELNFADIQNVVH